MGKDFEGLCNDFEIFCNALENVLDDWEALTKNARKRKTSNAQFS